MLLFWITSKLHWVRSGGDDNLLSKIKFVKLEVHSDEPCLLEDGLPIIQPYLVSTLPENLDSEFLIS